MVCIVFTVLTVIGVPLIAGIGITTALALYLIDIPFTLLAQSGFTALQPFPLLTIPLFILAGRLMEVGGMATRLIDVAKSFVGNYNGSLSMVTVLACTLFAALSGSGPARTAAIGSVMVSYNKARAEALGFTAKTGILTRVERIIVMVFFLIIQQPVIGLWIIAILANVTAIQRILFVRKQAVNIKE